LQLAWVARLFFSREASNVAFYVLALGEMSVPIWAEGAGKRTSWHPQHISERYGLFTLIVLGESISSATLAIQSAITSHGFSAPLCEVAGGGLLIAFGMWWWYFDHPADDGLRLTPEAAYVWGYGHYAVFASVASLGAGLQVAVEGITSPHKVSPTTAGLAVAISISVFLLVTRFLHWKVSAGSAVHPLVVALAAPVLIGIGAEARSITLSVAVPAMGVVVGSLVVIDVVRAARLAGTPGG
jgi:low temperature requirement protein LtrA